MYTRKHHKRTVQSGGATPDGKIPLSLMTKGERFIRCRGQGMGGEIYQMQRTEAWFQGEKIYQMQRTEAWFQGEHE
jgi:hypothetical protein